MALTPEQLQRAREVFEAVAAERGTAREDILRLCDGDTELCSVVERMIASDDQTQPILDRPFSLAGADGSLDAGGLQPGARVGRYAILREIGAGGMGTVYLAERAEGTARAQYAVKILRWSSQEFSRRFRLEQEILSGCEHPNIARWLDSGTTEDRKPYFVMEYVDGRPFRQYCEQNGLSTSDRLRLFRQVCGAVRYLHQNLVVHRDLKPSNILITAEGQVKLVDFGIAKLLPSSETTGVGLMTPDYASPEQIRGGPTSTLTDVYSLGVLLYELLTGTNPFRGPRDAVHLTLRRICEEEPEKLSATASRTGSRKLYRELRGELDNIVLKAIRKQPIDKKFIDSGVTVVTKENLNTPAVQKLLNPQK